MIMLFLEMKEMMSFKNKLGVFGSKGFQHTPLDYLEKKNLIP